MTSPPPRKTADLIPPGQATITVTCAGIGPPLVVRVRRALKYLLRAHGLRAVAVDLPPDREGGGK